MPHNKQFSMSLHDIIMQKEFIVAINCLKMMRKNEKYTLDAENALLPLKDWMDHNAAEQQKHYYIYFIIFYIYMERYRMEGNKEK